jgi:hypothetical protein
MLVASEVRRVRGKGKSPFAGFFAILLRNLFVAGLAHHLESGDVQIGTDLASRNDSQGRALANDLSSLLKSPDYDEEWD